MSSRRSGASVDSGSSVSLRPTFIGYVGNTTDAIIILEACLSGILPHVGRRPHDRERPELIKSGYVYIYEEHSSGIKRWTDGVAWSPSRILGNFLIYRELKEPFPPGEKKRAAKKVKPNGSVVKSEHGVSTNPTALDAGTPRSNTNLGRRQDDERSVYGSLIDSYEFKDDGLVKKTISFSYRGVSHHLVSYYTADDIFNNRLSTPREQPELMLLSPRPELIFHQNFRSPLEVGEFHPVASHNLALFNFPQAPMMSQQWARTASAPNIPVPYHTQAPGVEQSQVSSMGWTQDGTQYPTGTLMQHQTTPSHQDIFIQGYQGPVSQPYAHGQTYIMDNSTSDEEQHQHAHQHPHQQPYVDFQSVDWQGGSYQSGV